MTVDSPLYRMVRAIRDADMSAVDRELLRPAFAALDGGPVIHLPERVIARVRDIHARMPKSK
ncbi:hypothetical protein [Burkholderia gladioli]|uniref:hypothetical protein n=1 Tax=Burkholderia gladioli TaxID=28095 RepID=UPI000627081A|nr:hypothetical protein [Burkholderia gladioli]KKJ05656.1 hypothetical protein XF14_16395 [Burkholderia gladioli]